MHIGPLTGIKVADFSSFAVGPWAGTLLGALGADVIKVEQPGGDPLRAVMPLKSGYPTTSTTVNLNKRSVILNLKDPEDHRLALTFATQADVLIENYRPGVTDESGIGYQAASAINPRLVYVSVSAFGPHGPLASFPGPDPVIQAWSGVMSVTAEPDGGPLRVELSGPEGTKQFLRELLNLA